MSMSAKKTDRTAETTNDPRWASVVARAAAADGTFVYSVKTTGVYCRPSCAARRARPENVRFHATGKEAAAAGFRPCKRCKPDQPSLVEQHAEKVTAACRLIESAAEGAEPGAARAPGSDECVSLPPRIQGDHRRDAAGVRARPPRQAGAQGARPEPHRDPGHLRFGLQLERPVLRRFARRARDDADQLSCRRRRHRDPLRHRGVLARLDSGRPERAGRVRDPAG